MKLGFANGCFDLFHEGHRHFLSECRRYCNYLVVAVNSDRYCREVKGKERPYEPIVTRMLHVRAFAEAVIPFEGEELLLIAQIKPDIWLRGYDHPFDPVREYAFEHVPMVWISSFPKFSTSTEAAKLADAPPKG